MPWRISSNSKKTIASEYNCMDQLPRWVCWTKPGDISGTQEACRKKEGIYFRQLCLCFRRIPHCKCRRENICQPFNDYRRIGVIMEQAVAEDLMKKIGIQPNTIKSGKFKDVGSPFRKMQDDERAYFQQILDSIHQQFIEDVAEGRKMPVEQTKTF